MCRLVHEARDNIMCFYYNFKDLTKKQVLTKDKNPLIQSIIMKIMHHLKKISWDNPDFYKRLTHP